MTPQKATRGSRLQCQLLTSLPRSEVAQALTDLTNPFATVDPERDTWMPRGREKPLEARLELTAGFVAPDEQKQLADWWLAVKPRANTPNWDLVSTCTIEGKRGLILVEAKAHANELETGGKRSEGNTKNHARIAAAIQEANDALNQVIPGWSLQHDAYYQLSNRFAWAWKLASLKIPVVLIYLGFLNVVEMENRGRPFTSPEDWEQCMRAYTTGIVPESVWDRRLNIGGTSIFPLIRSLEASPLP